MEISFLKQLILVLNLKLFLMKCPSVVSTHNKSGSKVVYTTGQFTRQAVSKGTDEFYLENFGQLLCVSNTRKRSPVNIINSGIKNMTF